MDSAGQRFTSRGRELRPIDRSKQLYEQDAAGWQRGLYEDIKQTFRAPIVNWIFRTTVANYPDLARYMWGQVKPVFQTRQFGHVTVAYRNRVLTHLDAEESLPRYRRAQLDVSPAEFAELRGQLATYDVVAPRLAVLFEVVDRSLTGGDVAEHAPETEASTAPLPQWLDRDRGRPTTMIDFDDTPQEIGDVVPAIQAFHDLDEGLPSIYRTMAQWPGYLRPMWNDVEPVFESDVFSTATDGAKEVVEEYVDSLPYTPQLSPGALEHQGFSEATVDDVGELFRDFNRGPIETVIPALPVFAYTVGVEGHRTLD